MRQFKDCVDDIDAIGDNFSLAFCALGNLAHEMAIAKGWWDQDRNNGELIALIHSELSEALEALRINKQSETIGGFEVVEELADAVIRIMDMASARRWDLGSAIVKKMLFNAKRPIRHRKKF